MEYDANFFVLSLDFTSEKFRLSKILDIVKIVENSQSCQNYQTSQELRNCPIECLNCRKCLLKEGRRSDW